MKTYLDQRKSKMIDEVKSFVDKIFDYLSFLRDTLIVKINREITLCQNDISDDLVKLQKRLNDLEKKIKKSESNQRNGWYLDDLERCLERGKESKTFCEDIQTTLLINEILTLGDIKGHTKQEASSLNCILGSLLINKQDALPYSADIPTQGMSLNDDLSPTTAVTASKDNKNSTKSTVNTRRSVTLLTPERSPMQSKSPKNRSGLSKTNVRKSPASVGNIQTPHFVKSPVVIADEGRLKVKRFSLESDKLPKNITSSAFFDDGVIVLCDTANKKLLLIKDYTQRDQFEFASSPRHIAHIPGYGVAVTIPQRNCIQYISVTNGVFGNYGEQVETKSNCKGVCYANGNLIYASGNAVTIVEMSSKIYPRPTRCLKEAFNIPCSIYSDHNENIFITCYGVGESNGETIKMTRNGNIDANFNSKCKEICKPVCAACDHHGYIYVCDTVPPSIHQLHSDGIYKRKLLQKGRNDGTFEHINVLPNGDLLLTEKDKNEVSICQFLL